MLRRLVIPFLIFGLMVSHRNIAAMSPSPAHSGLNTTLLEDGLLIDWYVPPAQVIQDSVGMTQIDIEGFNQDRRPGAIRLPVAGALIAIPQGENPVIEIHRMEVMPLVITSPLAFAESPDGVLRNPDGQVVGGKFASKTGEIQVGDVPVQLESIGVLRGIRLARLVFSPVFTQGESFKLVKHIQIQLRYAVPRPSTTNTLTDQPILATVRSMVINPQHVVSFRPPDLQQEITLAAFPQGEKVAAIEVESTGLISITRADLRTIGFPVGSIDPNRLHLTRSGSEIAYQWVGDQDEFFENNESLLFYAEPRFSRWTNADVYFLWQGESPGIRMDSRSANPGIQPFGVAWAEKLAEINTLYTPDCYCAPIQPGRDGDRWVWDKLQRSSSDGDIAYNYAIQLPSVESAQTASLTLWLISYTDVSATPDHKITVLANATTLGDITWDGKSATSVTLTIPPGTLQQGENTITLALPGIDGVSIEGAWLDAFSLRYTLGGTPGGESLLFAGEDTPHMYQVSLNSTMGLLGYDVTDPMRPVALTDLETSDPNLVSVEDPAGSGPHRYWVAIESAVMPATRMRLITPLQTGYDFVGAEYLIIAPAAFSPALNQLAALRESQGFSVAIEDIQAIYDAFGDGRPDPNAFKAYLVNAYNTWPERPIYILLVGDGTSDPKRYQTTSSTTFIPPFLAEVDPWAGETASDNRYVTIEGEDNLPEMLIGRLPANSLAEAQTMISKIVQYETDPEPGVWSGIADYVADDRDGAGDFPQLLEALVKQFQGPTRTPQRLYFDPDKNTPDGFHDSLEKAWNFGSSLMIYAGHASIHQWAAENFIHLNDIPGLSNENRLPVLLELTCFTGSFQIPGFETFDENLLRHPTGGVVAAWGSTGLGISTGHHWLAEGFLADTFSNPTSDLGSATLAGKIDLAATGFYPDLIDTFTLIGDPATQVFSTHSSFMPMIHH